MKHSLKYLVVGMMLSLMGCSSNSHVYDNPNLLNVSVYFTIYLNLPQFTPLNFDMNPVFVDGYGNGGVVITKVGSDNYIAFDAADPNHPAENCSTLQISGIKGVCQCNDHNVYNLVSGTAIEGESGGDSFEYTMKPYQVIDNRDGTLTVKN